jgi:DNA-binding LacI/PurR family transcriptional regulator
VNDKFRAATSFDVARLAGASQTTVSLVLGGRGDAGRVSKATQKRVVEAAERLNYVPNRLARDLRRRATQAITIVVPSLQNPFFAEVVGQAQLLADARGYSVNVMVASSPEAERRVLSYLAGGSVDGVMLGVSPEPVADLIRQLIGRGVTCVMAQAGAAVPGVPNISIDLEYGGFLATDHLIRLGHRRIAYITDVDTRTLKYLGYKRALEGAGIAVEGELFALGANTMSGGAVATSILLERFSQADRPTAIFAYNDLMAIGALRVLREAGLRVPQDVAVVGFDGTSLGAFTNPALTTVSHTRNAVVVEVLFKLLEKSADVEEKYEVPITLAVRESCGASIGGRGRG